MKIVINNLPTKPKGPTYGEADSQPAQLLLDLSKDMEWSGQRLRAALNRLTAIEMLHNRMVARVGEGTRDELDKVDQVRILTKQRDNMEKELGIDLLYDDHREARIRFAKASEAFTIGRRFSIEGVIRANLRKSLFAGRPFHELPAGAKGGVEKLARALKDYFGAAPSGEKDKVVRSAWHDLDGYIVNN